MHLCRQILHTDLSCNIHVVYFSHIKPVNSCKFSALYMYIFCPALGVAYGLIFFYLSDINSILQRVTTSQRLAESSVLDAHASTVSKITASLIFGGSLRSIQIENNALIYFIAYTCTKTQRLSLTYNN